MAKPEITFKVKILNECLESNSEKHKNDIIRWIRDYISSRWSTGKNGYFHFNGKVLGFSEFFDVDKRRKRRLIVDLDSKEYPQISISMYKFKKYIRQRLYY